MPKFPLFVNGAYRSQSPVADDERTINWYPEPMESEGAASKTALYPTPGVSTFATVTEATGGRAAFAMDGRAFFVIGTKLVEVFADGTYTIRGTVSVGTSPATISSNGEGSHQLYITSGGSPGVGGSGYSYNLTTNTLTSVVTQAVMGGEAYGYFFSLSDNSTFRISNLEDGLTWDVLQVAAPNIAPDPWRAMVVTTYGQAWLLGEQSTSVYYNNGQYPFPFAPDPSGLIPYGIAAPFSAVEANESVTWLATTRDGGLQVMSASGFTPKRISDFALENEMSTYGDVSDAEGETYRDKGHTFYLLSFPSENKTWVFDFSTGQWHERSTWISELSESRCWRPNWHCYAFGLHLMCDRETGAIYHVSTDYALDVDSRPIRRVRRSPAVVSDGNNIRFSRLEILLEPGLGLVSGQGSAPVVMLRFSDDAGKTWSNYLTADAGAMGNYQTRVWFSKLGIARHRVFELSVLDPIPWRIVDAYILGRAAKNAMAA